MKINLMFAILASLAALLAGYFISERLGASKIPNDIVTSFENCTRDCDQLEDAVKERHRVCREAWQEEAQQAGEFCEHTNWGETCRQRITRLMPQIRACEDEYQTGLDNIKACRIRCNQLISITQR